MGARAVILGGGLSGLAAACELARAGWRDVLVVERGEAPGGLAGSFERDGRCFPLGYHHILGKDKTLLHYLDVLGVRDRVHWRRVRMLFELNGQLYDLASPRGFTAFPMPWLAKLRFIRLMVQAFAKADWSEWEGRSAGELIDAWAGATVRRTLFEPLCRLKFELPARDVSAAWLGARLHFREGATPLGYIPGVNWTKVLCDGMAALAERLGVEVRLNTSAVALEGRAGRMERVALSSGERLAGRVFVSTLPPPIYLKLTPGDETPHLGSIAYTALISVVCAAPAVPVPSFYWLNLSSMQSAACAVFRLDALNPTLCRAGEMCFNFVTHLNSRHHPVFAMSEEELMARYLDDFARLFRMRLDPSWVHVARVPMYSPIFDRAFRNPPVRGATWENVYFAGNYRTFPSVASTGTALASGVTAAAGILADYAAPAATVHVAA